MLEVNYYFSWLSGSNPAVDVNLRLRAIMISGRLLSKENAHRFVDESSKVLS